MGAGEELRARKKALDRGVEEVKSNGFPEVAFSSRCTVMDVIHPIIAGVEESEGEEALGGNVSTSFMNQEEIVHQLGTVGGLDAGGNYRDDIASLQ